MPIRAVIFDYGEVLCQPDPVAHQALLQLTGLDDATFRQHYWIDRHEYDLGRFDGSAFWRRIGQETGRNFTPAQIQSLIEHDVLQWTSLLDEPMLAWTAALQDAGFATAILSNMPFEIDHYMRQEFGWLAHFTHLTFSCEHGIAKPDPAIYTFTCEQLGVLPEETLFVDDKQVNVEAAERLGLHAIQFRNVAQLRDDLESRGLLLQLPTPGEPAAAEESEDEPEVRA
jgi:putative hydrolase of the HAD superfamily